MARDTTDNTDWERIDEDEDAETGDTRIRVVEGDHGTYEVVREEYSLVAFPGPSDDIEHERYDWSRSESFTLYGENQAEQVAGLLAKADAFDPNVVFFRQRDFGVRGNELAKVAHRLWSYWSMAIAESEDISQERLDRWEDLWVPFEELDEEDKETDRELVERFRDEEPDYPD